MTFWLRRLDRSSHDYPQAHYVIVGERYSTKDEARDHENHIRQQFTEEGLAERAHFLGVRRDIPEIMTELSVLAQSGATRTTGARAARSGGIRRAGRGHRRRRNARDISARRPLLIPPNDPVALAAALRTLLDDRELRQHLATAALDQAQRSFDASMAAAELAKHYLAAISGSGVRRPG